MDPAKILEIVLREMTAYGQGWRLDWSDFDGRSLRDEMEELAEWARKAPDGPADADFTEGSEFLKRQTEAVS